MTKLVSVIIPCYNVSEYLTKCVNSILKQSYSEFEIILVNDGSTDTTGEICETLVNRDKRIKVYHKTNGGVSSARNLGLKMANGELIAFIDGDDYIKKDFLYQLTSCYRENSWPIGGMQQVRSAIASKNPLFQKLLEVYKSKEIRNTDFLDLLAHDAFSSPCARLYNLNTISKNEIKFDERITYQEDLVFNIEYAKHIQYVQLVDYFGYNYVAHVDSSSNRFHKPFLHVGNVHKELLKYVRETADLKTVREFTLQTVLKMFANTLHKDSNQSRLEKINTIRKIVNSDYYTDCYDYIVNLKINTILKSLMRMQSSRLIYLYYKLLHS